MPSPGARRAATPQRRDRRRQGDRAGAQVARAHGRRGGGTEDAYRGDAQDGRYDGGGQNPPLDQAGGRTIRRATRWRRSRPIRSISRSRPSSRACCAKSWCRKARACRSARRSRWLARPTKRCQTKPRKRQTGAGCPDTAGARRAAQPRASAGDGQRGVAACARASGNERRSIQHGAGQTAEPAGASSSARLRAASPPSKPRHRAHRGTGPGGRIIRDDVQAISPPAGPPAAAPQAPQPSRAAAQPHAAAPSAPVPAAPTARR